MSVRRLVHAVRLELDHAGSVHENLSGAACCGDWLWVIGDEASGVERLRRLSPVGAELLRYGEAQAFAFADLLALPGAADEEADPEGLALIEDWLWVVGSHGRKRKRPKPGRTDADNAERLAEVTLDANRLLLAGLPVEPDAAGRPRPVRVARDGRRARRLEGDGRTNLLTRVLADDPLIGPFMGLPGKDNGFDIEGVAVAGERLLLGLRGPVLRGWSLVLEIAVTGAGEHLALAALDGAGTLVRKHVLSLDGLGIRDLHWAGDDLLVLAGPTLVLDGAIRLFRWRGARQLLAENSAPVRFASAPEVVTALPHGPGTDRAEALCAVPSDVLPGPASWLVLYDAPGADRLAGEGVVFGDLLQQE